MTAAGTVGKAAGKIAGQADGVEGFEPEAISPERRRPAPRGDPGRGLCEAGALRIGSGHHASVLIISG